MIRIVGNEKDFRGANQVLLSDLNGVYKSVHLIIIHSTIHLGFVQFDVSYITLKKYNQKIMHWSGKNETERLPRRKFYLGK